MLRIVEDKGTNGTITLILDGRLVNQWVDILRSCCEEIFQNDGHVMLDLNGLRFADRDGVTLLQQLERRQVRLINRSPFIEEQMKIPTSDISSSEPVVE